MHCLTERACLFTKRVTRHSHVIDKGCALLTQFALPLAPARLPARTQAVASSAPLPASQALPKSSTAGGATLPTLPPMATSPTLPPMGGTHTLGAHLNTHAQVGA